MPKKTKKSSHSTSKKSKEDKLTYGIVALIVNFFLPGIGSIIGGKTKEGIWQIILWVVGAILTIVLVGYILIIISWIWGIVTGARLISEAVEE